MAPTPTDGGYRHNNGAIAHCRPTDAGVLIHSAKANYTNVDLKHVGASGKGMLTDKGTQIFRRPQRLVGGRVKRAGGRGRAGCR